MRIVNIIIALVLLFAATGMTSWPGKFEQLDLQERAKKLVAQKNGLSPQNLKLVGKPAKSRYPYLGMVLYQFKFRDTINEERYGIALTLDGREADTEYYDVAELEAFAIKRGKTSPDLWDRLENSPSNQMIEVNIWVKVPPLSEADETAFQMPDVNGENIEADEADLRALEQAVTDREIERVRSATAPLVETLDQMGYQATSNLLAPLVNVTLPASQIRALSSRVDIDTLYLAQTFGNDLDIARATIKADIVQTLGFDGTGEKIGMVEYNGMVTGNNPYLNLTRDTTNGCAISSHATGVAGIIRSRNYTFRGIAPAAYLWAGCGKTDLQLQNAVTRGVIWGADTLNLSWHTNDTSLIPDAMDRFMDRIMYSEYNLVVKSAGNEGAGTGNITSPGLGYNTLSVGNFDDRGTVWWTGDVMSSTSSFKDPISNSGDREKPEVAAPGKNITTSSIASPWSNYTKSGTSLSAPMVTGITALMMDRNVLLRIEPEAVKAILMATAVHNIEGATRLSEFDGAGGVDASFADYVSRNDQARGRWGSIGYTCSARTDWNIASMSLTANKKTRVAIVWYQDPDYSSYTTKPSADLDLAIHRGSTFITNSASWDNTYEIVEFTPTVSGTYTIWVHKHRCSTSPKRLGWAWYQFP